MHCLSLLHRLGVLAVALALVGWLSPADAQSCTTTWTNPAGGDWNVAGNWSSGVPGAGDNACITNGGAYTVTKNTGAAVTVNSLVLGGGSGTKTLVLATDITFGAGGLITGNGVLQWTNRYVRAGTLLNQGTVQLTSNTNSRGTQGATAVLRNEGSVTHNDNGAFYNYNGGRTENAGTWNITGDGDLFGFSSTDGTFVNEAGASLSKTGGTGETLVALGSGFVFENHGAIRVESGTVRFDRPSTHSATASLLTTAPGATLRFNTGSVHFAGTFSGNQVGTLTLDDDITTDSTTGATWSFTGNGIEWVSNYLTAGTLVNQGLVRLTGNTNDRGSNGATAVFRNEGLVTHNDNGAFYNYNGGRTENTTPAPLGWNVTGDGDLFGFSSTDGTFVNEAGASFRKTGGTGQTLIALGSGFVFENAGSITVASGEVRFDRPSVHSNATLRTTSPNAVLRFNGGGVTFNGTVSGNQVGTLTIGDNFSAVGGPAGWNFTGNGIEWVSDDLTAGTLVNQGLVRLTGNTNDRGSNGATAVFRNEGTVRHSDNGAFYTYSGGRTENATGGSRGWIITGGGDFFGFSSGGGRFVNEAGALLRKTGGAATLIALGANFVFDNFGTVSVESGEIDVDRPFIHREGAVIQGTGTFDVANSDFAYDGIVEPGTSPGMLTWETDFEPADTSTFRVELCRNGTGDRLNVTGAATLEGTLEFVESTDCSPPMPNQTYTVLAAAEGVSGTFDIVAPFGYTLDVSYGSNTVIIEVISVPNFDLAAINTDPGGSPIVVPKGGAIDFLYSITNNTVSPITGEFWYTAKLGSTTVAEMVILSGTLPAGTTITPTFTQPIPGFAPTGTYSYTLKIGQFSTNTVVDQVLFTVIVTPPAGRTAEGGADAWTARDVAPWVTADGSVVSVAPETAGQSVVASAAVPETFGLASAYPNPFRASTRLSLDMPEAGRVTVVVYDALGRQAAVLLDGEVEAGTHRISFDGSSLSSGVYLVRATGTSATAMQRVTLVR